MHRIRGALHDTFRSLGIRNFRLFFGGQLVSQVGNWLTLVAQVLLVLHLTDNNGVAVGVLTACQFLPVLVLGAWAGLVADRVDKRRLLIATQTYAMVQSFALAALAFMPHPPLVAIFVVAMLGGIGNAFDNPVRRAFVVEMVPNDNVPNAVSLNSALMTSSRIFGPALAGLLIVTAGYGWCFTVDGISYLAVIVCLFLMRSSELHRSTPVMRAKGQVRAGLHYIRSIPDLFIPLVMMALIGTFAFNFNVVIPLFVVKTLDGSTTMFTVLFSVLSVGSLIGALVSAHRSKVTIRSVAIGALLFGISMFALALAPSLGWAFPIGLLVGFSSIVFMTASTAIVQVRAAPEMRGRVLAVQAIVFLGSTPIGGPILGVICQTLGPPTGLAVGATSCLAAAFIGWRSSRRSEDTSAESNLARAFTG
jgi:MFS family permease